MELLLVIVGLIELTEASLRRIHDSSLLEGRAGIACVMLVDLLLIVMFKSLVDLMDSV